MTDEPMVEVTRLPLAPDWSFYVDRGLFGLFRLKLCRRRPGGTRWRGHGAIERVMDTRRPERLVEVIGLLLASADPAGLCRELARPWSTDHPMDRIRLDNAPGSRVELWRLGPDLAAWTRDDPHVILEAPASGGAGETREEPGP